MKGARLGWIAMQVAISLATIYALNRFAPGIAAAVKG